MLSKKWDAEGRRRGPTKWGSDPGGGVNGFRTEQSGRPRRRRRQSTAAHAFEEMGRRRAEAPRRGSDPGGGVNGFRTEQSGRPRRRRRQSTAAHAFEEMGRRRAEEGPHEVGIRPRRRSKRISNRAAGSAAPKAPAVNRGACFRRNGTPKGGGGAPRSGDPTPEAE